MQIIKNKTTATFIALILMLTLTGTTIISLPVNAATLPPLTSAPTYAYITASPDPAGVGQPIYLTMWLIEFDPLSAANEQTVWQGYSVTVTAPNGANETLGSISATAAATASVLYTPTQTGNYTFTFNFAGQLINSTSINPPINTYYEPSSAKATVTVQQEPISIMPETPLPTNYWTRPIYWENQNWYVISGNWFGDINTWDNWQPNSVNQGYNPDTVAPGSAHIMWTNPITFGGQIGGSTYSDTDLSNYYTGKSYEQFFYPPVIINGVMYYNKASGILPAYGVTAVDLRTGQNLWYQNISSISYGEVFSHHNPNEVGGIPYLWQVSGSNYLMYDATTGNLIETIANSTGGTAVLASDGELLVYTLKAINSTTGWLAVWNSTQCVGATGFVANQFEYRPQQGATIDWKLGIQSNTTVPIYPETGTSVSIQCVTSDVVLVIGSASIQNWEWEAGYNATTGAYMWSANRTLGMTQETTALQPGPAANGVYTEHNKETGSYYGFSLYTGKQLWGPTTFDNNAWDIYTRQGVSDGSGVYFAGPGSIQAFNLTTGAPLWDFTADSAGYNSATPTYLFEGMYAVCSGGGEIFAAATNSHGDQLFRGAQLYAVNTTTGQKVWSINGFFDEGHAGGDAIADGYLVGFNGYDNQVYCFGKGPSDTTVTAPDPVTSVGAPIVIRGTVTDIAAGSKQNAVAANFPNGLPAVSDDSMSQWMEYVYMQQPFPSNTTGVPVTLSVIDANGNVRPIGQTTSDASGMYSLTWKPDIPGDYTVIANFGGSQSYYGSSAETSFYASPAATPAPTVTTQPAGIASTQMDVFGVGIAIIVVLIIIGALILLTLRKRP